MNTNFIRTILNIFSAGTFTSILTSLFGCTGTEVATASCTAPWIPVQYQALAGVAFVVVGFLLKMFGGTGATVGENLGKPVVPVVPEADAKVGVVTPKQVAASGTSK